MLIILLVVVGGAMALILLLAAIQPDGFRVERRASVGARPETVFALINDFHRWPIWSPWEKLDPALQRTYGGPDSGVGAVYSWRGNSKVGAGRMAIAESISPERIVINIDFLKPMQASHVIEFVLQAQGGATQISWIMVGRSAFAAKIFGVFCNMDQMVGRDFEAGLAQLKSVAESR